MILADTVPGTWYLIVFFKDENMLPGTRYPVSTTVTVAVVQPAKQTS